MSERWLLVGATGRLGRAVLHRWREEPPLAEVVPQARRDLPGHLVWSPLDQRPPEGTYDAMLVLAGAVSGSGLSEAGALTRVCLGAAGHFGVRRVLLASSSVVYGPGRNLSEETPCWGGSAYARSKLELEAEARQAGVETCCLRIGNVAGADALLGQPEGHPVVLDRFADGDGPRRSYIGPESFADVLAALMAHPGPLPRILNLAAPHPVRMADLLRASGRAWNWRPAPATAVQDLTLDCSRLAELVPLSASFADPQRLVAEAGRMVAA